MSTTIFLWFQHRGAGHSLWYEKLNLEKFSSNYKISNINIQNSIIKYSNTKKTIKNRENYHSNENIGFSKENNLNTNIVKKKLSSLNKR